MLENSLEKLFDDVFHYIIGDQKPRNGLLLKKHSENLQQHGDFSFSNIVKSWHGYLDYPDDTKTVMHCIGKEPESLVQDSKDWVFQVNRVKEVSGRVHLFLARSSTIRVGLLESSKNNDTISQNIHKGTSLVQSDEPSEVTTTITSLRIKHLAKSIQNLYSINAECRNDAPNILVSCKSPGKGDRRILCGAVLNAKTGVKEMSLTADDFIGIRQNEMTLIAQHKYGVRVSTDDKWKDFTAHLGESAAIFELLQTKPSSAVKIDFECCSAGSSKGASFILYNGARLETIIRTYGDKVVEGVYSPLPAFESTDFSLLTHEDEWSLIYNFILGFPYVLSSCVTLSEKTCEFRPHHICNFLSSMVRVFSQYYRRTRILTEPRGHMLPVLYARMHMLKALNDTLKTCLRILNIKSVCQM